MSSKKKYEYRESNKQFRDHDGLKQRRLKDEARWKFNPNADYSRGENFEEEEDWFLDSDRLDRR